MQPSFGTVSTYPQPGDVLEGKYRVERLLGEGGMGAVAKATHLLRRAPVALKFMSGAVLSLQGAVERFVNEGVAASQIDSDHVVKVFDVGRLPSGAPYLVMEYLEGWDLGQLLEREGPTLAVARAVHFTVQILRALHTAHAAGIIHRDMKPSNCFVIEKDGEPDFVKLVDFGISKVRTTDDAPGAHLTRTNSALGTPLYMSPEQARSPRDVDHRTDLYSVGAILYEMLSGRTPYTADSGEFTEILFKIFTTEPEPLTRVRPDVPEALAAVVHRALQRDLGARYASAVEMSEALVPFADERSATVLARLRAGRRSETPAPLHSLTPVAEEARATQSEATARTFASGGAAALRPGFDRGRGHPGGRLDAGGGGTPTLGANRPHRGGGGGDCGRGGVRRPPRSLPHGREDHGRPVRPRRPFRRRARSFYRRRRPARLRPRPSFWPPKSRRFRRRPRRAAPRATGASPKAPARPSAPSAPSAIAAPGTASTATPLAPSTPPPTLPTQLGDLKLH